MATTQYKMQEQVEVVIEKLRPFLLRDGGDCELVDVEDGIVNTINSGVPAEKLINAVPFYTRVWKTKDGSVTADTMGMGSSAEWCTKYDVPLNWSDETCQNYGEKEMNGTLYQVWLEDAKSLEAKLSVMDAHECAGVAEWKLGLENAEAWDAIRNYLGITQ